MHVDYLSHMHPEPRSLLMKLKIETYTCRNFSVMIESKNHGSKDFLSSKMMIKITLCNGRYLHG